VRGRGFYDDAGHALDPEKRTYSFVGERLLICASRSVNIAMERHDFSDVSFGGFFVDRKT
jgi:hypothetical protein